MNIKKFQGKNKDEALNLAKKELGDVVILNTKKIKVKGVIPFIKKSVIEITVATQEKEDALTKTNNDIASAISSVDKLRQKSESNNSVASSATTLSSGTKVEQKLDNITNLLEEKLRKDSSSNNSELKNNNSADVKANVATNENKAIAELENFESVEPTPEILNFVKLLYNTMIDNEIREQYANQMIDDVIQNYHKEMTMEYILSHIYQKIVLKFGDLETISPATKGPKVIYFIGPTGVGKTTTLAKIASQLYFTEHKKIAMFTIDTYRIAASDQLSSYANIMDVPMEVIYKPEDMQAIFPKYANYNYILVDTAGHSSKNEEMSENTNAFLHCLDELAEKEVYLVLSATTKYKDLINIADYYSKMANYKLIFTKLDETYAYGNMLNVRLHTKAAMSYVTCGQNVPDDFEQFDVQEIVKKLLVSESDYNNGANSVTDENNSENNNGNNSENKDNN